MMRQRSSWEVSTQIFSKGYDRCGTLCAEDIGIRIGPNGSKIPVFDGGVKIDTKIAHEHDPQAALC